MHGCGLAARVNRLHFAVGTYLVRSLYFLLHTLHNIFLNCKAVSRILDFTKRCGSLGEQLKTSDRRLYEGRKWARLAYRPMHFVLDPKLMVASKNTELLGRMRAHAISGIRAFLHNGHSPEIMKDHMCAVFEVPQFTARLVTWFYKRESSSVDPEFSAVVQDVVNNMLRGVKQQVLAKHHGKALLKLLKSTVPCEQCQTQEATQPKLSACKYCNDAFYCNAQCCERAWEDRHSNECKSKWKAEIGR